MKKRDILVAVCLIMVLFSTSFASASWFSVFWGKITGHASNEMGGPPADASEAPKTVGPDEKEIACMTSCMSKFGCSPTNRTGSACGGANSETCQNQCGAKKPIAENPEIACMEACVIKGCDEFDFTCQNTNKDKCEKECNMIKEPPAKNEEEQCIRDCVKKEDPNMRCGASQTGETGGELCRRCAKSCEHLYAGPCLGEPKLSEKKKACETCQHCYGATIMGPSGEGWDCIVDVECKDATSEWGDEPGVGAGIGAKAIDLVDDAIISVRRFVSNIFSPRDNSESPDSSSSGEASSGGDSNSINNPEASSSSSGGESGSSSSGGESAPSPPSA